MEISLRDMTARDSGWVAEQVRHYFGSTQVVSKGNLHDTMALPGFIASSGAAPVGFLHFALDSGECEVVTLGASYRRQGIGSLLLGRLLSEARRLNVSRAWLITTNNNKGGVAFYKSTGWRLVAVHEGAVNLSRLMKPEIPLFDEDGIAIEDELEFEFRIG